MGDVYDRLYRQLEELIPGLRDLKPGDYRKSGAPGFMDLHLDVLTRTKEELRIALAHNYQQNGDTIADPDMEIRVYLIPGWEKAEALTYQDARRYDEVYPNPNLVNLRVKKSLNDFLTQWLKNLKDQGHRLEDEDDVKAQEAERKAHEEAVLYHFGEGRLEAENEEPTTEDDEDEGEE